MLCQRGIQLWSTLAIFIIHVPLLATLKSSGSHPLSTLKSPGCPGDTCRITFVLHFRPGIPHICNTYLWV